MTIVSSNGANGKQNGANSTKKARLKQKPSRAKLRGLRTLDDLDGRTSAYRFARELVNRFERDLGGADQLTTSQQQLVQRAAVYGARILSYEAQWLKDRIVDPTWDAAAGVQRRILRDLGIKRDPNGSKELTLQKHLDENYADADEDDTS
jgi:hypothetical protein